MFNLLGNLIFGYRQENNAEFQQENNNDLIQTCSANQSTQTIDNNNTCNEAVENRNSESHPVDWVLVDRSEEAEKCNNDNMARNDAATNTSMIQSKIHEPACDSAKKSALCESTTTILGSFFEKNSEEDEEFNRKYKQCKIDEETDNMTLTHTINKDWLITPLPCLTSITASQRSIIENDPLENLLIEHPSMSVFVAATSSSSADTSFVEEMNVEQENKPVLGKTMSEKRKVNTSAEQINQSPPASLKRKGKKNKKSTSSSTSTSVSPSASGSATNLSNKSGANKENLQVLMANDFKRQSNLARLESYLLNKNQMKRSNKNSVFSSANKQGTNNKQRKYHKLQQPLFQSKPVF